MRPCVDATRSDRRDGAASAVVLEPERDLRRRATRAVTAEAATAVSRRAESVVAAYRNDVGRPTRHDVRRARAVAVRPCVDAARGDRQDGAASAGVLEPERALRRRATHAVTAEAAAAESRRAERAVAGRRSDVGRPPRRNVRLARSVAVRPCVDAARGY